MSFAVRMSVCLPPDMSNLKASERNRAKTAHRKVAPFLARGRTEPHHLQPEAGRQDCKKSSRGCHFQTLLDTYAVIHPPSTR